MNTGRHKKNAQLILIITKTDALGVFGLFNLELLIKTYSPKILIISIYKSIFICLKL
jgi:hypothetical protein